MINPPPAVAMEMDVTAGGRPEAACTLKTVKAVELLNGAFLKVSTPVKRVKCETTSDACSVPLSGRETQTRSEDGCSEEGIGRVSDNFRSPVLIPGTEAYQQNGGGTVSIRAPKLYAPERGGG